MRIVRFDALANSIKLQSSQKINELRLQRCSERWFLRFVSLCPAARGSQDMGLTQPRNNLLEYLCNYSNLSRNANLMGATVQLHPCLLSDVVNLSAPLHECHLIFQLD